jgi:hypothetical protein
MRISMGNSLARRAAACQIQEAALPHDTPGNDGQPPGVRKPARRGARAGAAVTPGMPKLIRKAEALWLAAVPAVVGCSDRAG